MKGIVVGVDESRHARAALRWAVVHASFSDGPVCALMAWGYLDQHHLKPLAPFDPQYSEAVAAAVLDDLVADAVGSSTDVQQTVICDLPGRALLEAGEDASLLVVGARGIGGFRGLLLGSVSRQVLHRASCPVAVIRDDAHRVDGPVIVGVDGSEPSVRALSWAVDHARRRRLRVVAVHAWHLPATSVGIEIYLPDPKELADGAEHLLHDLVDRVDTDGLVAPVERRVVVDRPSAALLEASCSGSMLVVGSRGHGKFAGALLGSVSDQVSQHATCPVVVVP